MSAPPALPTLRGAPVVGLWPALARDLLDVLERVRAIEGDLVRLDTPGGRPLLVAKHPRDIRRVLVDNAANGARTPFHDRLRAAVGNGLLTSEGEIWTRQRRKLQPLFNADALASYTAMMGACARDIVARWRRAGAGAEIEVERDLSALAMAIVGRALFGDDAEHDDIFEAVAVAKAEVARRQFWPLQPPRWAPAPGKRRLDAALARLDAEIETIRRAAARRDGGLVGRLARDGDVSPQLIRDEAMIFFLAGHETSAAALAWAVDLLARHPEAQAALAHEARTVVADDAQETTAELLDALPLTRAVVEETLRIYPSAPWFSRRLLAADTIAGVEVPAGALVMVSPWLTHRDPRWWPEPERFRPERFTPKAPKPAPMSYFPFGGGPRTCIGLGFARMEMTVALALIARAFRLEPTAGPPPRPRAEITLRPETPIRLKVFPRV